MESELRKGIWKLCVRQKEAQRVRVDRTGGMREGDKMKERIGD